MIIKVPTHVKHVYHHHLKTVHIQQPSKKDHHIQHEHYDDIHHEHHHDRDDNSNKRSKGYGSWRGLDSDSIKYTRDYRGRSSSSSSISSSSSSEMASLSHEKPPPLPASLIHEIFHGEFNDEPKHNWRNLRNGEKWRDNYKYKKDGSSSTSYGIRSKGVVYEQESYGTKNFEKSKRYEEIDLTYNASNKKKNTSIYREPERYNFYEEDQIPKTTITNFNNNLKYRSTTETYGDYISTPKILLTTTKSYPSFTTTKSLVSNYIKHPSYIPQENRWNENRYNNEILTTPINLWLETTTNIPSIIPSIWPDLNINNNWLIKNNNSGQTNQINNNKESGLNHMATSFVYHNQGTNNGHVQETIARPITNNSGAFLSPLSSVNGNSNQVSGYQVQVIHYTEPPNRVG